MRKIPDSIKFSAGILILLMIYLAEGSISSTGEELEQNQYCEMVQLYRRSEGEFGWPPYKGEEQCK